MKKSLRFKYIIAVFAITLLSFESCKEQPATNLKDLALNSNAIEITALKTEKKPLSEEFKKYWYAGDAELTSYKLEQARYGEVREGTSVLIFVTEPFLADEQVKANNSNASNVPVLKLNATKKYITGIYPYSLMSSTFYPVSNDQHAIKTSFSMQEWCGHNYMQLNNREQFEFTSHSYFEGEADQNLTIDKALLENEIWHKIRIDPETLPLGNLKVVPSLEFYRTKHIKLGALPATANLTTTNGISTYTLSYDDDIRTLTINFTTAFPHTIESWTEEFKSGYGANAKKLTSTATKMKSLKTPYWRQNKNKHLVLRDSLGL